MSFCQRNVGQVTPRATASDSSDPDSPETLTVKPATPSPRATQSPDSPTPKPTPQISSA